MPRDPDQLVWLRRARDHADRHYTDPIELNELAAIAQLSKYHFHRLFREVYGVTPGAYLSARRIERAADLLRTSNLTVTEVCMSVGFTSLGSFSSRFAEVIGESPSRYQARWATGPRIPGCWVFMRGLGDRGE